MNKQTKTLIAFLLVYLIWGSTYLVIVYAIDSIPPMLMAGTRFLVAGGALLLFLKLRGAKWPTQIQGRNAALIGVLMLAGGNGGVTFAEQWVPSSLAAIVVATVPLWVAVWVGLFGQWPTRVQWLGLAFGFLGVVLLNLGGELSTNPLGAIVILIAPVSWALGSALSRKLAMPDGAMGFALEMLAGGVACLMVSVMLGESLPTQVTGASMLAWVYLVIFGSLIAFSAYMYLLQTVEPALATSYAYVNPIVAVMLGVFVANEQLSFWALLAMGLIVISVVVVSFSGRIEAWLPKKRVIQQV